MYELSKVFAGTLQAHAEDRFNNQKRQPDIKPEIDEVVCHTLEGDNLKDALNFIDNIRASRMKIEWSSINVWSVYRGFRHVMDIKVANNSWSITLLLDHAKSRRAHFSSETEGVRKLINSLRNSVGSQRETQYASS
ncbi:MAG: hypothetical protein FWC20_07670 [Oscillospiraceae bacterium]|nr:hypothetical protein [Oscillospiraceae bacterium]MCL2279267.1 hypothetical protein [Oscillospiraceae bacterium]